jgi:hypothetical protein
MAAQRLRGKIDNIRWGGGPINITFCDRAGELDRTARSPHQRHHNQPMYAGAGAGRARGWLGSFGFTSGCLSNFWPGGFRHSNFETRRTKAIEPPGPSQQQHNNQTMDERRVGAQVARGVCMGGRSDLPFLPCCYC